ncbi:MAG: hypothetical protein A2Z35_05670 [Actinobacteria bacterium RBG_19FT_COMBO_36_27]|nr:MAG: hypothetical protein A2Z35_05670 [Actinobacteria bacterium RBG_19FT_COMBO_36_27]
MCYIGLDLGTSGVKAVMFRSDGTVISHSYKSYNLITSNEGSLELDPNNVWESVVYVLKYISSRYKNKTDIKTLSISSFGEAYVSIDKDGNVLSNSILATDIRGESELKSILKSIPENEIIQITGLPLSPTYSINKILWMKNNQPNIFKKVWKLLLYQDFICFKLCGETVTDYSLASRTMVFDINSKKWSKQILEAADVDPELFSKTAVAGTIIEKINRRTAQGLNLPESLVIVLGGHDQPCAALGAGVIDEGYAVDSTGTTEALVPVLYKKLDTNVVKQYNFPCEPFVIDGVYNTMAFIHTAGILLKWFGSEFAELEKQACVKDSKNLYKYLDDRCPEEPTKLFVLPHFAGSATPSMDIYSKGAIIGLSLNTTKEEIFKAFMEGITYEMRYNIECLDKADISLKELIAVGGGANSDVWLQIKADILNKEISVTECTEAAAMGAAILSAKAIGDYDSYKEAIDNMVKTKRYIYPDEKRVLRYESMFDEYKELYFCTKEINNFLSKI